MEFVLQDNGRHGILRALENGEVAGEIVYTWAGPGKFVLEHTEVRPAFEGKGVGKKLVMELVAQARRDNLKIVVVCPFAKKVFERDPSLNDVVWSD